LPYMGKYLKLRHIICQGLIFAFCLNSIGPVGTVQAQDYALPAPGIMVNLSPVFAPPILKGIKVHPDNPFRFDFILDRGEGQLSNNQLKEESSTLIKYFLASLTIPEKDLWVNLSPYEKNRIVPASFGQTEMGRDLLAEDYMLKQITASLIYPEGEVGKRFWKRVYEEAALRFGTTNIPVNTFNKVWIVPEKAVVYENAKAGTAYVVESKLKVMLEQDYLALSHSVIASEAKQSLSTDIPTKAGIQDTSLLGSQIIREIVIPQLTKEVNEDKNFAQLRQVYNSLILATWYKKKIKDSVLEEVYGDKNKVAGVNIDDPKEKERIYQRYLQAFKKGTYNYIKEEFDPISQQSVPRKYFSGGTFLGKLPLQETIDRAMVSRDVGNSSNLVVVDSDFNLAIVGKVTKPVDAAMRNTLKDKFEMAVNRIGLTAIKSSDLKIGQDGKVSISGYALLPKQYIQDMEQILSWCQPEDLQGLNVTVSPFWHPMSLKALINFAQGFQNSRGITLMVPLKREKFIQLFIHELTHWILRNKRAIEMSLSEHIFDARDSVLEGGHLPTYYSGINKSEYAAELAAYAITHRANSPVITSDQREMIVHDVFNTTQENFYFPSANAYDRGPELPILISAMGHIWLISLFSQSPEYVAQYSAFILISYLLANAQEKYKDLLVTKKVKRTIEKMKTSYQYRYSSVIAIIGLVFISMGVHSAVNGGISYMHEQFVGQQGNEAVPFVKGINPADKTIKVDLKWVGHEGENSAETKGEPTKAFLVDDSRFLGPAPYIDGGYEHSISALLAMVYKYYGIDMDLQKAINAWGFWDKRNTYQDPVNSNSTYYGFVHIPTDDMKAAGLKMHIIATERESLNQRINAVLKALKKGHPVLLIHYGWAELIIGLDTGKEDDGLYIISRFPTRNPTITSIPIDQLFPNDNVTNEYERQTRRTVLIELSPDKAMSHTQASEQDAVRPGVGGKVDGAMKSTAESLIMPLLNEGQLRELRALALSSQDSLNDLSFKQGRFSIFKSEIPVHFSRRYKIARYPHLIFKLLDKEPPEYLTVGINHQDVFYSNYFTRQVEYMTEIVNHLLPKGLVHTIDVDGFPFVFVSSDREGQEPVIAPFAYFDVGDNKGFIIELETETPDMTEEDSIDLDRRLISLGIDWEDANPTNMGVFKGKRVLIDKGELHLNKAMTKKVPSSAAMTEGEREASLTGDGEMNGEDLFNHSLAQARQLMAQNDFAGARKILKELETYEGQKSRRMLDVMSILTREYFSQLLKSATQELRQRDLIMQAKSKLDELEGMIRTHYLPPVLGDDFVKFRRSYFTTEASRILGARRLLLLGGRSMKELDEPTIRRSAMQADAKATPDKKRGIARARDFLLWIKRRDAAMTGVGKDGAMITLERGTSILQSQGFRRENARMIMREVLASTEKLTHRRNTLLNSVRLRILLWKIRPLITSDPLLEGTRNLLKITIKEPRKSRRANLVERVAHELWHEFRKRDILGDAYAELRLLEEDLTTESVDVGKLFKDKSVGLNDYERILEDKNRKLYEDRHDEADLEPSWYYGFGEDLGQLLFLITNKNIQKCYRILDLMDTGLNLKESIAQVDAAMKAVGPGGIDLSSDKMNLQTKMDSRFRGNHNSGIKFHLDPAQLQELENAPGFVPVIISIQPLNDLKTFLGVMDSR